MNVKSGNLILSRANFKRMHRKSKTDKRSSINIFIVTFVLIISVIIISSNLVVSASDTSFNNSKRYYKDIVIEKGDTLWDIAVEFAPENEEYNQYIKDIMRLNKLHSNIICPGDTILIYYYK